MSRVGVTVASALLVGLAGACAQQGVPPGGPEDARPPVVISTFPDTFAVIPDMNGSVRFDFDERISERGAGGLLASAVVISPRTGDVRVRHERRSLIIDIDGGFLPGQVYRVTLLPDIRDLFNNQTRDPFELVFSTGPELHPTTIAGIVWDRVTGNGAGGYEVQARPANNDPETDSIVHIARTDTGGVYAFRFIPEGRYQITAFEDRDRDAVIDTMEIQGTTRQLISAGDTLLANIAVNQPDTTAAILTSVTALDSVTVLIEFDDYLDPDAPLQNVGVAVQLAEDSSTVTGGSIFHAHEYVAFAERAADSIAVLDSLDAVAARAEQAVLDSIAAEVARLDSLNAEAEDTLAAAPAAPPEALDSAAAVDPAGEVLDTAAAAEGVTPTAEPDPEEALPAQARRQAPPGLNGRQGRPDPSATSSDATGPSGERLPSQQIVVRLDVPLTPNTAYRLVVTGIRNLNAIPLGGGEAALVLEGDDPAEGEPAPAALDTATVRDTTEVIDTVLVRSPVR